MFPFNIYIQSAGDMSLITSIVKMSPDSWKLTDTLFSHHQDGINQNVSYKLIYFLKETRNRPLKAVEVFWILICGKYHDWLIFRGKFLGKRNNQSHNLKKSPTPVNFTK